MKSLKLLPLAVLAVLAGCDPYSSAPTGSPNIGGVTATNGEAVFDGSGTGNTWAVAGVTCTAGKVDTTAIHIEFDKQLNGAEIQTSVDDCTPAGNWATITPAPAAGNAWYTCYSPSSPTPELGGSIVVYQAPATGSAGFIDALPIPAPGGAVHITGTVGGTPIDVTVNTGC